MPFLVNCDFYEGFFLQYPPLRDNNSSDEEQDGATNETPIAASSSSEERRGPGPCPTSQNVTNVNVTPQSKRKTKSRVDDAIIKLAERIASNNSTVSHQALKNYREYKTVLGQLDWRGAEGPLPTTKTKFQQE